jgi:hypothetical protein
MALRLVQYIREISAGWSPHYYEIEEITTIRVFAIAINNTEWLPITLPAGVDCNCALGFCRSDSNVWSLSHDDDPAVTEYATFKAGAGFSVNIDKDAAAILFYVKGTEAADYFQVILGRKS